MYRINEVSHRHQKSMDFSMGPRPQGDGYLERAGRGLVDDGYFPSTAKGGEWSFTGSRPSRFVTRYGRTLRRNSSGCGSGSRLTEFHAVIYLGHLHM